MIKNSKQATYTNNRTHGFTLIEVMVASVILFSVIATVSMIYRGAFISSEKANNHINITSVLPSVLAIIRDDIRNKENAKATLLTNKANVWQVNYQWQANVVEQKFPPKKFDPFTSELTNSPKKYKLWQVQLSLESNGLSKSYSFNEISWVNQ